MNNKPVLLLILDGWGESQDNNHNAIAKAETPQWDLWRSQGLVSNLKASGRSVGLPKNQMGNSEVGHMHIGAGRVIKQNLAKISDDITSGDFFKKIELVKAIEKVKATKKNVHLIGLVSDGGVHSHEKHLYALLDLIKQHQIDNVFVHAFLDGRDTAPTSGIDSIKSLQLKLKDTNTKLASICGRFYAMDRDNRWHRVALTYELLTKQQTTKCDDVIEFLNNSYQNQVFDEFIKPTALKEHQEISDGDLVIHFNFRADRARQLSDSLTNDKFNDFKREKIPQIDLLTMTQYERSLKASSIYANDIPKNTLGECLQLANKSQLRIAETEKYAHVTFFLNGGKEQAFNLEERILIPSPKVKTYDLKPQMSAVELTEKLVSEIHSKKFQLIVCNYANADMVGHTGNLAAAIKAIEALDQCLIKIDEAIVDNHCNMIVTADHGNAEKMFNEKTKLPYTSHTNNPVPFIYIGEDKKINLTKKEGCLTDIAPTILNLLNIKIPKEMTGVNLLSPKEI